MMNKEKISNALDRIEVCRLITKIASANDDEKINHLEVIQEFCTQFIIYEKEVTEIKSKLKVKQRPRDEESRKTN